MGAGKTSIGRQLAELLHYRFLDSDHEIEARAGVTIPWIFDVEGEEGFRRREQAMLEDLTQLPEVVLATGGGGVIRESNRRTLQKNGIVVYLKADLEALVARTRHDKNRPLLQTANPRQKLLQLLTEREPWYLDVADIVFHTGEQDVKTAARALLEQLNQFNK